MHCLRETTDDPDTFISGEVDEEDVLTDVDAITEVNPAAKGAILLHCGLVSDCFRVGCHCSCKVSHEVISLGSGLIFKP